MILLDTHVLVWYFDGDQRLGPAARQHVDAAIGERDALISAISFWELAMLVRKERLALRLPIEKWSRSLLKRRGVRFVSLDPEIAIAAGALQGLHGDPSDRIIIASARAMACPLVTGDRKILAYAEQGHLRAIDAHR